MSTIVTSSKNLVASNFPLLARFAFLLLWIRYVQQWCDWWGNICHRLPLVSTLVCIAVNNTWQLHTDPSQWWTGSPPQTLYPRLWICQLTAYTLFSTILYSAWKASTWKRSWVESLKAKADWHRKMCSFWFSTQVSEPWSWPDNPSKIGGIKASKQGNYPR